MLPNLNTLRLWLCLHINLWMLVFFYELYTLRVKQYNKLTTQKDNHAFMQWKTPCNSNIHVDPLKMYKIP